MSSLLELTPAEMYLLAAAPKATLKRAVMITMKDLSLKDVIDLRVEKRPSRSRSSKIRLQANVYPYHHFRTYQPVKHEHIFLEAFSGKEMLPLHNYLREIYLAIEGEWTFGKTIRSGAIQPYFNRLRSFGRLSAGLNRKGKIFKQSLFLELNNQIDDLIKALSTSPYEAWEIMKDLNGFIYLVHERKINNIIDLLQKENERIQASAYSEQIYKWFLEMEKIREFDPYFNQAVKLVKMAKARSRFGSSNSTSNYDIF